jgi:multiple sugar transport system substrate-binding protein
MKNKYFYIVLTCVLTVGMFLSACTKTAASTETTEPSSGETTSSEPVTIKVMSYFAYDNPEVEQAVVAAFEEKYPDITVELESVPLSDIILKYKTLIAGNEAPDVMAMNLENSYAFASLGAIEPLDQWITNSGLDTNIYYKATLDMWKFEGVQYYMPATFSDVVLYYNKDLFDAAGLAYPARDWTWDDLKAAAVALTKDTDGDGKIDQWGYSLPWWPIMLETYNASIWSEDGTTCTLNSPEGIKAIQTMVDARYTDKFAPTADQLAEQGDWDMFIAGRLAMFPSGPWAVQPFNDGAKFTFDIAHMPAGDKQATQVYANSYGMSATSEHKDAAWKFIEFATGPEGTKIRQDGKYEISPVKEIAEKYYVEALSGDDPEHAIVFMEVLDYAVPQPLNEHWSEISDAVQQQLDLALIQEISVEDALDAACQSINEILSK